MLLANFNRKEHLRHRAVSLRQHGFLVLDLGPKFFVKISTKISLFNSVARYHSTTAAPRHHFSTVPVPSALRYYLVPQYHNYRDSSARYFPMLTHSNEHQLDCIVFGLIAIFGIVLCRSLLNCTRFSYVFLCWPNEWWAKAKCFCVHRPIVI